MAYIKLEDLPTYTYVDYLQWKGRWELIEGHPYAMSPSPVLEHQHKSGKIHAQLPLRLEGCADCQAVLATDWKIDNETVLCPDNAVVCHLQADDHFIIRTPAIIFEVLSPSTKRKDRNEKFHIYQEQGVSYYVMVDPATDLAEIYQLLNGRYHLVKETTREIFEFDLAECILKIDFSKCC
ncbi:Uma2 family endonuclease [Thiosulfativibrio zosterae]|uniref:Putative restriction endonuclease domain-containing protein n=1 Tax=Thiosulfativibrio zosterae TaxID=2675053 RepID=A0A6F8PQ76_9GAMM|nr:Uma2 family endonuclease [Thiosulfativibrio zosterae]BBP44282.1 hypothetical protein THMIRHAT_20280 [Thiosulfativibrio zosterae]